MANYGSAYPSKTYRVISAATTNATLIQAGAGVVYAWCLYNRSNQDVYVKFYNKASAPTVGSDAVAFVIALPSRGGHDYSLIQQPMVDVFTAGIAYAITRNVADSDATAIDADDVHGFISYA